jgi:hypothetical protein
MNDEEKLYTLMAQAEDLQTHAAKLQNKAQETFSALPLAVEQSGQKIRFMGLQMALILLPLGIVASAVAVAVIWWGTSQLREEAAELRVEVKVLEAQAKEFSEKAGKAVLSNCGEKGKTRLCIRVDERAGRYGDPQKGLFMVIDGY